MATVQENGKWLTVSIKDNGDRFYYHNNQLHREKGPAIELADGNKVWYYEGKKVEAKSQKDFEGIIKTAQPQYYTVKIETMVPATLTFKVLAESPEDAATKARKASPSNVQYRLGGRKDLKATIYDFGSSMIKLITNLAGK